MTGSGEVMVRGGQSASGLLWALLNRAVTAFPDAFSELQLSFDATAFKQDYQALLPQFEACRIASAQSAEIATYLARQSLDELVFTSATGETSLSEHLLRSDFSVALNVSEPQLFSPWHPSIPFAGREWSGKEIAAMAELLESRHWISEGAAQTLSRISEHSAHQGIDLRGHRIAIVGASAEMAPTAYFLRAGADVLWIDQRSPPEAWQKGCFPGRLYWPQEPIDLLTCPEAALAALRSFSEEREVHVGLYAYAPGSMREFRLTGVMNAMIEAMPRAALASVGLLVSPTTPTRLATTDQAASNAWWSSRSWWMSALRVLGLLRPQATLEGSYPVSDSVVTIQGASYQAAQYLGKTMMAEAWVAERIAREQTEELSGAAKKSMGITEDDHSAEDHFFRVSANTAPITQTRSLAHPVFAAAFEGARALGVETFRPEFSQQVGGLLWMQDWMSGESPLAQQRVHGGIHPMPYQLQSALYIAAAIGFVRRPWLLKGLFG